MARKLTHDICHRLKVEPEDFSRVEPEPTPEMALKYVQAYFEDASDAIFGLVCRPIFETRLQAHLRQETIPSPQQDPSWYALRNAVYASGCRALLSKENSGAFRVGKGHGWHYFQNALSMHTYLLFTRTNLMAVQALTVMVRSPRADCMAFCAFLHFGTRATS